MPVCDECNSSNTGPIKNGAFKCRDCRAMNVVQRIMIFMKTW